MKMWVEEPHQSHTSEMKIPVSLSTALAITVATTLAFGVVPGIVTHFTDVSLTAFAM